MQANHLKWAGLVAVAAFLAVAWIPSAGAVPNVPCELIPDEERQRSCSALERQAYQRQNAACWTVRHILHDAAGDDVADAFIAACRGV